MIATQPSKSSRHSCGRRAAARERRARRLPLEPLRPQRVDRRALHAREREIGEIFNMILAKALGELDPACPTLPDWSLPLVLVLVGAMMTAALAVWHATAPTRESYEVRCNLWHLWVGCMYTLALALYVFD